MGGVTIEEEDREPAQLGDMEVEEEDQSPSNSVGGGNEIVSNQKQNNREGGLEEVATTTNPMEGIAILEAPTTEAKSGATLDAATVEVEDVGAIMTEGYANINIIESSPEWRGALIEEEIEMAETRGVAEMGDIPSTSVAELETFVPWRKRRRSKE